MSNFPFLLKAAVSDMSVSYWRGLAVLYFSSSVVHKSDFFFYKSHKIPIELFLSVKS